MGVGIPKAGDSITVLNEMTTYDTWEFVYDPRIEQFYAKNAALNGGTGGGGLPGGSNLNGGLPGDSKPNQQTNPNQQASPGMPSTSTSP